MTVSTDYPTMLSMVKAIRSLDQDGNEALTDKIDRVWKLLSTARSGKLFSPEESVLRWLLKHMNGTSEAAEQLRRYPLTWASLDIIFQRIPSSALADSLDDRRFIPTLIQTAKEISQQTKQTATPALTKSKRKREDPMPSDLDQLRSPQGCLKSANAVFKALHQFLQRADLDSESHLAYDQIGAQHIKALVPATSEDARNLISTLLAICEMYLRDSETGLTRDQKTWIQSAVRLWELHRRSTEDASEVATHLYRSSCLIISRLKSSDRPLSFKDNSEVKNTWTGQLEIFLVKEFLNTAKTLFVDRKSLEMLKVATATTAQFPEESSCVLWDLVLKSTWNSAEAGSRKTHETWVQAVFPLLLESLKPSKSSSRNAAVIQMLEASISSGFIPDMKSLSAVCENNAFGPDSTDWALVSSITRCEPDVFVLDDGLAERLCKGIAKYKFDDQAEHDLVVSRILVPLMNAFARARDLIGLAQTWCRELAKADMKKSPWFDIELRTSFAKLLQSYLSIKQVLDLLQWLRSQDKASQAAVLVLLEAMCNGINQDEYIDAVGSKIFDAAFEKSTQLPRGSEASSLRWRIAACTATWSRSEEVDELWEKTKKAAKQTLTKGPLAADETFEAFHCCHQFWLANYSSGRYEADLTKLNCALLDRIITSLQSGDASQDLIRYIEYMFQHTPRLTNNKSPDDTVVHAILKLYKQTVSQLDGGNSTGSRWYELLEVLAENPDFENSESLLVEAAKYLTNKLESSEEAGWTSSKSLSVISALLLLPTAAFTRELRKRLMGSWKSSITHITSSALSDDEYATGVLRLVVKIMQQPTFYDNLEFDDLTLVASIAKNSQILLALAQRFAQLTFSQMLANSEESSVFLKQAANYVESVKPTKSGQLFTEMVLLKGLLASLDTSGTAKDAIPRGQVDHKLQQVVECNLSAFGNSQGSKKSSKKSDNRVADDLQLPRLKFVLDAALVLKKPLDLPSSIVTALKNRSDTLLTDSKGLLWKLEAVLIKDSLDVEETVGAIEELCHLDPSPSDEDAVAQFVDAALRNMDAVARLQAVQRLLSPQAASPSVAVLVALKKISEQIQGSSELKVNMEDGTVYDLSTAHAQLLQLTKKADSFKQLRLIADTLHVLLDKHAGSMKQWNCEETLAMVSVLCATEGCAITTGDYAGETFTKLQQLVAIVIKRHRLRLRGHFNILIGALQALLQVLLADPNQVSRNSQSQLAHPAWLGSRLKPVHAAKFARLLTLVCEPSAASVARASKQVSLDSATDKAKKIASEDVFRVIMLYIKLQLKVDVSRAMRKALEPGIYSILNITPPGLRAAMNEAMDADGRPIFREMWTDYKKFGKWTGV